MAERAPETRGRVYLEIQTLRLIAVMGVVIYHLWPARLPGGYVGVDVFFVISGFLITSHLLRELYATGRIRLGTFYARRARRLLPAALLVLALTAIATWAFLPERAWEQVFREVIAAAVYVENWVLAADSVDYLAQNANIASPVQHYWSLSVEEQFYLVWPLLLLVGWLIASAIRSARSAQRSPADAAQSNRFATIVIAVVLGVVFVGSLISSILLTYRDPGPAYFATHTRAWEFAAGGLIALAYRRVEGRSIPRSILAWVGFVMIAVTMLTFNSATPFPGYFALIPVVGTMLVIVAGNPLDAWSPRIINDRRISHFIGDISYSLYLFHWPIVVFAPAVLGRPPTTIERVLMLAISIILATLSKRFVEDPVRSAPFLARRRPRVTAIATVLALVPLVVFSVSMSATAATRIEEQKRAADELVQSAGSCLGAGSLVVEGCSTDSGSGVLVPSPDAALTDDVNSPDCWSRNGDDRVKVCSEGPTEGAELRVALVGDSHSNQYLSAMKFLAEHDNWRYDVYGKTGCVWTAAVQQDDAAWVDNCESWKRQLNETLLAAEPYDVIITSYSGSSPFAPVDGVDLEETIAQGFVDVWEPLIARGTQVVAIRDNPRPRTDYLACIEANRATAAASCAVDEADAFPYFDGQPEAVSRLDGAHLLDLTQYFCQEASCPPVIGQVIVYRDATHITSTYARSLAPMIRSGVLELTGESASPAG